MPPNTTYDAVIVLANLMDPQGNLNDESLARLTLGADIVKDGSAPIMVTCGWAYRSDSEICIADAMRREAMDRFGLHPDQVFSETSPRDTVGDAVFTKRNWVSPKRWRSVVVATSQYHVTRTQEIFSFVFGPHVSVETRGAESDSTPELRASEDRSLKAFRATFSGISPGEDAVIFRRLVAAHPFYNGDVYPVPSVTQSQ